jgi:allophanate hydrolase subunit 2
VAAGAIIPLVDDVAPLSAARFERVARGGRTEEVPGTTARSVRWFAPMLTLATSDPLLVRFVDGVHAELFEEAARTALVAERWRVAPDSNRMGYRLLGPKLALRAPKDIVSQGTCLGTVQVPGGGQPIVLMADHQTTGGYPRIAEVVSADTPRLAQAAPGAGMVRFERVNLEQADRARDELARRVDELLERLRWEFGDEDH